MSLSDNNNTSNVVPAKYVVEFAVRATVKQQFTVAEIELIKELGKNDEHQQARPVTAIKFIKNQYNMNLRDAKTCYDLITQRSFDGDMVFHPAAPAA